MNNEEIKTKVGEAKELQKGGANAGQWPFATKLGECIEIIEHLLKEIDNEKQRNHEIAWDCGKEIENLQQQIATLTAKIEEAIGEIDRQIELTEKALGLERKQRLEKNALQAKNKELEKANVGSVLKAQYEALIETKDNQISTLTSALEKETKKRKENK